MIRRFAVLAMFIAGCSRSAPPVAKSSNPTTDQRISYYQGRVDANPRLVPVWIQLAEAMLDKGKETSDVQWIIKAREAAGKALAQRETYAGMYFQARITGHTHRFEESLAWAKKAEAATAMPPDLAARAIQIEALVGLGRLDDAKAMLPGPGQPVEDFYTAAALARIANEEGRLDDAARLYGEAAKFARAEKATPLVAWAEAMVGGMTLDGGNFTGALPHLDMSKALGGCIEEEVHRAEVLAGTKREREALAAYAATLAKTPDPSIHHAAFELAKQIGDERLANEHAAAAERGYRAVMDAGEPYTLGALAQLLLDRGGDVHEALRLAQENMKFKRDREARATLEQAQQRAVAQAPASPH